MTHFPLLKAEGRRLRLKKNLACQFFVVVVVLSLFSTMDEMRKKMFYSFGHTEL